MTDCSNASRTLLMNLSTLTWDANICAEFGIPTQSLPQIKSNSEIYCNVKTGVFKNVPISGVTYFYFSFLLS